MTEGSILLCTVTVHALSTNADRSNMPHMPRAAHQPSESIFQPDLSEHMLGVPKVRPRFDWFLFAIVVGTLLALGVITLSNVMF
jgi:hypothetical protein